MRKPYGFTLIELMVVVAVMAILTILAVSSYKESVRKSRRSEAYGDVGQLQLSLERWRSENPCYGLSAVGTCPTFTASGTYPPIPTSTYYTLAINAAAPTSYTLTATPLPGSAQAGDRCGILTATGKAKATWATASCN
jgi:type IV pilus assembly protein PilE